MRTKPTNSKATKIVKDIRRANRKLYSAEEKIRIVLEGLRGETTIAELCRQEGIAQSMYYKWSKEFLEAGKQRLAGDTAGLQPQVKSKTCAVKHATSRKLLLSRLWNCAFSKKA